LELETKEATAHADGEVVDASFDVLAYWEFLDWATNDQNHWLNVTAELSYMEISVDGVLVDTNMTSTSVILKTVPDAGNTINAPNVREISPGTYKAFVGVNIPWPGFNDTDDYYKIYVGIGMVLHLTMKPHTNTDFDLYLYNPNGQFIKSSKRGTNAIEEIYHPTNMTGYWFIRVNAVASYGIYALTIDQPYPAPWVTVLAKITPSEAEIRDVFVMIGMGGVYSFSPVTVAVLPEYYYIGVESPFTREHYSYTFHHWADNNSTFQSRYENIQSNKTFIAYYTEQFFNNPPNIPQKPEGKTNGHVYTNYPYYTNTTDSEGDDLRYEFSWGDETSNTLTSWFTSGANASASHSWTRPGTYSVSVRAQDSYTLWSSWSTTLTVNINQNDAGTGYDAGNSFTAATYVSPSSYTGALYQSNPTDTTDWYQFCAAEGQIIGITMTPPSNANFNLELYDPSGTFKDGSYLGTGYMDSVSYTADASGNWRAKIYIANGEGQYSFSVTVSSSGGGEGGCPILYVYSNEEYVCEGLLDIHNPEGIDIITYHNLAAIPQSVKGTYLFRLIEHPYTCSHIDQIKLYAVLENGRVIKLPLVWAWHSEDGSVLPQLLFSDDYKTDTLGAIHNNGTSQSINVRFIALPRNLKIIRFIFQIEGNNPEFKT